MLLTSKQEYAFLQGGGEMGALTRAFDWSETSLGMPDKWPQSLRTTLGILLHSAFPMFLFWGNELTCFYNDTYRPSLGTNGKHPALGKPAKEVWPEIWAFIGPLIDQVLATGEPVWFEDQLVPIYRNGQLEDVYWTFSYSPAYGDDGQIEGVLVTCAETTQKVINAKLQQEMTDLLRAVFNGTAAGISVFRSVRNEAGAIIDFEYQLANRVTEQTNNRTDLIGKRALTVHQQFKQAGIFDDFITVVETGQTIERDRHYAGEGFDNWYTTVTVKHDDGVVFSFLDITAERTARQQVEVSEQRFQAAIDAVQGILWTNNAKGEMEGEQPGWAALTGQTYEDYQGYGWANAVYPDDAQPTVDAWQEALKQRGMFVFEHRVRVKNGNWESFSIRAIPLMNPDGSIREWVGVHTNITERVLAQQRIEQSQQQLLALFEQSPVGIAVLSEDNLTFRMANSFYGQLVGRKTEEIIDKPLLEALPELKGQGFDELLRKVIQTGVPFIANEVAVDVVRHNQLETIYVDFAYQPQREADTNHISSVFAIVTDVTQQVRSRQQVETSEAKLRSVVETAPVAIGLFMGRDLVVELPNQTFIDIVGKGPDIVGRPLREVMPELLTENQPFLQILDDVFTSGKQFHSFGSQVKIVQQGVMTYNYYNITYSPLFNEVGEVYAILDIAVDVTGQVMTQQELARQKTYLQNAIDIADLGTYQVDVITNVGYYTDKIQQWFGLEQLEQPMDIVFSKVHPDDRPTVEQTIADTLLTEDRSRHDITYRLADASGKTTRYLRSIGKALFADGQPYAINGILQDVTPQIEARQAIETNEVKLRSLVESAPFPIGVYTGREMRIQLANQSILDVWGKGNEVTGKLYNEILPELANQSIFDQLDAVYTTGIPFHAKNQRVDIVVDGVLQPFYFNYSFTPLFDAAGQVYGVMNTAADITELATAKQQVEEVEVALRGAIDLAELGTWQIDLTTGILNYSERLRGWFGIGNNEIITAERAYRPVLPADRARVRAAITHAITPGTDGIYDIEYALDPAEAGQERILHIQGKAFVNEKGEAYKLSGTAQDVTKERRVQQELERQVQERTRQLQASVLDLERSNQNLQQFAYIASHDLQEPLRKIQSFGDILKTQHADSLGEGLDLLQRMQVAASRMSVLIKDLLAFSRISTRQEAASAVSLNQVVHTVLTDLELTIQETDAVIGIGPLPTVHGDASQLGQLFQNLLSNALKFRRTDPSGKLVSPVIQMKAQPVPAADLPASVRPTREAATYQRIDVIDNGIGFNQKYVDRIFQVFQRLHGRKEFAGTGVGLAICEKVVANHGGAITATSQPGHGATFSVYLPISAL